jgi:hypothetical protein
MVLLWALRLMNRIIHASGSAVARSIPVKRISRVSFYEQKFSVSVDPWPGDDAPWRGQRDRNAMSLSGKKPCLNKRVQRSTSEMCTG